MHEPLTPAAFVSAWGNERLTKVSGYPQLPSDAIAFLTHAGLPTLIKIFHRDTLMKHSYSRLSKGVRRLCNELNQEPAIPDDWKSYWVLGDETLEGGCHAAICIHQPTAKIVRIDVEVDEPIKFMNGSVALLATSLNMVVTCSEEYSVSRLSADAAVDKLETSFRALDPEAMSSDDNYWPFTLREMRDLGPDQFRYCRG